MMEQSKSSRSFVIRGLRRKHLKWSEAAPSGLAVDVSALMLRQLPDGRLEQGLPVFHPSANQDEVLESLGLKLGFIAFAAIDVDAFTSRGYEIVTKPHDPSAAEVLGLPTPGDPRAPDAARELLPALRIIRPPTDKELAAIRRRSQGSR